MENWKPIPGYEGLYEASDAGRIRTAPGKTTANARYSARVWKSRILKEKRQKHGNRVDSRVELWKAGEHTTWLVSRLVALAWHGVPTEHMTVNHINGDPLDNRPENLEWTTLRENIQKGFETGLFSSIQIPTALMSESGTNTSFRSLAEASRWLGRSTGYVSDAILKGKKSVYDTSGNRYVIV